MGRTDHCGPFGLLFNFLWIFSVSTRYSEGMTAEVQPWVLLRRRFNHMRLLSHDESHQKCSFGDGHAGSEYK